MNIKTVSKLCKPRYILLLIIIMFVSYNAVWYFRCESVYKPYSEGASPSNIYGEEDLFGKRYDIYDGEFAYHIKYPNYLSNTGNLAVGYPDGSYSLIIWPSLWSKQYSYGVILTEGHDTYYIYVNKAGIPVEIQNKKIIERHEDVVKILFDAANMKWNL